MVKKVYLIGCLLHLFHFSLGSCKWGEVALRSIWVGLDVVPFHVVASGLYRVNFHYRAHLHTVPRYIPFQNRDKT